ncbi:MAG: hypothetical protein JXB30_14010 [Anaerolineae bacterium]|nr:hypothetical protein [Anaerolineae bacterium]
MQASISEAMMCFITSAFCVYLGQTLCIVTSPMGIAYHNMGVYTLQTSWENVERVDFVSSRGFGKQRYLLLKEPVYLGARSNLTWVLPTDEQRERTIPLPVAPGWERFQELMEDIKHYAPHVVGLP